FTVDIDMSSQDLNTMNKDRNPEWEKNTVFLKLLVEGNAKLYRYNNENIPYKYLFSVDSLEVKQLIYKEYLTNRGNKARNLAYIEQLRKYVNCKGKTTDELLRVRYKEVDLRNYFEENNICENPDLENIKTYKKNKGKFNIIITPGINISSFSIGNTQSRRYSTDFDTGINLRIGTELEYVLPFNKNKWSVFIDPNYYSYSSHLEKELYSSFTINTPEKFDVTIKRFAVPFGIRHYFFLNDNVKFFVNAGYSYDMDLGSSIAFEKRNDLDMDATSFSLFGGVGVNFKSKYRAEIRYFSQDYLGDTYTYWYSDFNTISFVVGYNFL
ncbi:MAG: outer membrane beta-barrel protein, partial [Bacteroidota bacterium]